MLPKYSFLFVSVRVDVCVFFFFFFTPSSLVDLQAQRQQAQYDMVYVERLPEEQQMASGLFLPTKENPRMHVCKVCMHV